VVPVDISTASRATIGGMVGDNSRGAYDARYPLVASHVDGLGVVIRLHSSRICVAHS
jgi:FAD/FMN-containing dehydrogenase